MNSKNKLPIGVQNFEILRKENYLYVDKTRFIFDIAHNYRQVFLSRPRRFGKSLFLSAMRAYWEGKRELFEGLDIDSLESANSGEWRKYPVFYFDFNRDNYLNENALDGVLEAHISSWESKYGTKVLNTDSSLAIRFQNLLIKAHELTGFRCVVLVDEYDKPLLDVIHEKTIEEHNKAVFKGFFSSLKSFDEHLEFVFLTGVTRFSKISIFGDLNQLKDISMSPEYSDICGITSDELEKYFDKEITEMSEKIGIGRTECMNELRKYYDGYLFHQNGVPVYNPFSLLNSMSDREFKSYWFSTGTPTFLTKLIKERNFSIKKFTDGSLLASAEDLSDYQPDNPEIASLLYQTGYLTIRGYDTGDKLYTLTYPNNEVKYGLLNSLLPEYSAGTETGSGKDIYSIRGYVNDGDLEGLHDAMVALFAGLPYTSDEIPLEINFQNVIFLVFTLLDQYVQSEVHSSKGRADCIVQTKDYVYIFEFKRDESADIALKQIEEKGYALPFASDKRKVYCIGASFDSETRNLSEWKVE